MTDEKRMNIYFIRAGEYIKIGIAQNIKSRISALQTGQAVTIEFCGAKRNLTKGEARKYERKLHNFFRNFRASGEWFLLPKFDLYDEDSETIIYGDGGFSIDAILEDDTR